MQHGRSASRLRGGSKRSISSLQAFPNRRLAKIASLDGPCTILQQSHNVWVECPQKGQQVRGMRREERFKRQKPNP